eukprot:4832698-Amphidinium_carterae.1
MWQSARHGGMKASALCGLYLDVRRGYSFHCAWQEEAPFPALVSPCNGAVMQYMQAVCLLQMSCSMQPRVTKDNQNKRVDPSVQGFLSMSVVWFGDLISRPLLPRDLKRKA